MFPSNKVVRFNESVLCALSAPCFIQERTGISSLRHLLPLKHDSSDTPTLEAEQQNRRWGIEECGRHRDNVPPMYPQRNS